MPVQIQCTSVVIRNDSLDRVLDGGSENFGSIAPNRMCYSDDRLSQASFMSPIDAEEFAKDLELRGLQRGTDEPDFVIVHTHDQTMEPPCDWLILFEYEQRLIATIRGSDSRTVIAADVEHDPNAIQHHSADEFAEKFEFVERKGNIDTFREKATGKLVYHARTTENPEEIFSNAVDTVWKYRREPGQKIRQGDEAAKIREAIGNLQSLAAKNPEAPNVALALGMAWFAIGDESKATKQLSRAVELDPDNTMIMKELAGAYLTTNDFPNALQTASRAVAVQPDDIELLGNLAVIQLVSGDVSRAQKTIQRAIAIQPDDSVNQNVQKIITDVTSGNRKCPHSLAEMMSPPKRKQSWFARWFGR